ncbi:MAG: ATP synthase F1 subunit gamma [Patescibacteria group bacterium]|jgi:F-type H+-transporting ATPase subunit gamma
MANTRDITRRIKSVKNTKKITKAMEMVSSSKMRRAVNKLMSSRPYASLAWGMLANIAKKTDLNLHPLLQKKDEIKKIGVILITSNRGLCGSFNQQVVKKVLEYLKLNKENAQVEVVAMGKKGASTMAKMSYTVSAQFDKADVVEEVAVISPLSHLAVKGYLDNTYDKVLLVYTDYVSSLKQEPRVKVLLPLTGEADANLGQVAGEKEEKVIENFEYLFEPNPKEILGALLPRLVEVQIYQALLESNASEHSARMLAMRNASDAAGDMIDELTLAFNQARQANITREIAEIAGGKAALE